MPRKVDLDALHAAKEPLEVTLDGRTWQLPAALTLGERKAVQALLESDENTCPAALRRVLVVLFGSAADEVEPLLTPGDLAHVLRFYFPTSTEAPSWWPDL